MKGVVVEVWIAAMVGQSARSHSEMERGIVSDGREEFSKMVSTINCILCLFRGLLTHSRG